MLSGYNQWIPTNRNSPWTNDAPDARSVAPIAAEANESAVSAAPPQTDPQNTPARLNIGCSGWFYWAWRERFYPSALPTTQWFAYYASHFDTVELNAPFYSWPTMATVQTWLRQANGRSFAYTVKACELITHVKQFSRSAELVRDFEFIECILRSHMGCFLFQLPPSFKYTPARLKRIVDQLDPTLRSPQQPSALGFDGQG